MGRAAGAEPAVSQLRVRARPEITVDGQRLIDTGNLATAVNSRFLGGELAGVSGPFSIQSEFQQVWVSQGPGQGAGKVGLSFRGAYAMATYSLTGEPRRYDARTGVFTRFRPHADFDPRQGTWGAWEIAARISALDLNDHADLPATGGIAGGYQTNYSAGLNWYWSSFFRLQANYIRADVRRGTGSQSQGTKADIIGLRVHQEW